VVAHALTDGVTALVTNRPRVLHHPSLTPVFGFGDDVGAVVLSGAVGSGRLVAVADSSVLINNTLELEGNRNFARNLARFIRGRGPGARLLIADSDTRWELGSRSLHHPLAQLASALDRLARPQLPPLAVIVLSAGLAGLLLSVAATSLPRRSAYGRRAYLRGNDCVAGMAGRVSTYAAGDRNLLTPLLYLKSELERRAAERANALSEPAQGASGNGDFHPEAARELRMFLHTVERLQQASSTHGTPVNVRQFSELVAVGRRILADLDARGASKT
jgi:hypothetical protein